MEFESDLIAVSFNTNWIFYCISLIMIFFQDFLRVILYGFTFIFNSVVGGWKDFHLIGPLILYFSVRSGGCNIEGLIQFKNFHTVSQ